MTGSILIDLDPDELHHGLHLYSYVYYASKNQ